MTVFNFRQTRSVTRLALALSVAAVISGCNQAQLGPKPDNFVGSGRNAPQRLTDQNLDAVTPVVPGDKSGGAAPLPGAAMPGQSTSSTMPATQPATAPSTLNAVPRTEVPDALSVQDAILVGLENNINLRVQRKSVPIARTNEERELSAFDPTVTFNLQGGRAQSGTTRVIGSGTNSTLVPAVGINDSISGAATVRETLPTGTTLTGTINTTNNFYSESREGLGANVSVTQSLLRGYGLDVNLASLRQAQLSTKNTQYQLRGVAESLVSEIELSYWDLAYAERQVVIVQNSLDLSQKQLDDTNGRIKAGSISPSERPAAEAQVATNRENLIDAKSAYETARMKFLQLLSPAARNFWSKQVTLTTLPFIPTGEMDPVDSHVEVALKMRPDVNEAKLEIQSSDLTLVVTKNGLLPQLDLFLQLGKTSLASSFGDSFANLNGPGYTAVLGVQGDWEPINRSARASYRAAQITEEQRKEALDNVNQTVQFDVRNQYIEVERTRQQIDASRATRIAREQTLQVEQGNFAAGRGKSLDVSIAQNALLSAQLSEVQTVTNHLKALVNLYRLEGSLLLRRGLDAPGASPVTAEAWRH